jgi:CheY-like chemotaxis protein
MARHEQARDVLIVDDDREFVQLICRYLQSSGRQYNVRIAYDGEEGWRSLCQQLPDLLLLDVIVPGRDGLSTTQILACMRALIDLSRPGAALPTSSELA